MKLVEVKKEGKYLYNGKVLNLRLDTVLLPDESLSKREIVEHNGGSAVLVVKNGKILFVKQFRYAFNKIVVELPAGKIDKGESPFITAKRELFEECGIIPTDMALLYEIYPSPGYTNEKIFIYKVTEFKKTKRKLDDGEFLKTVWIGEDKVKKDLENGKIHDGKTVIALLRYFLEKK